jgi:phage terminase small subunit
MQVKVVLELRAKDQAFIEALCRGLRPTVAATASGYSTGSAMHLLRRPDIAAAVRQCQANLSHVVGRMDRMAMAGD